MTERYEKQGVSIEHNGEKLTVEIIRFDRSFDPYRAIATNERGQSWIHDGPTEEQACEFLATLIRNGAKPSNRSSGEEY